MHPDPDNLKNLHRSFTPAGLRTAGEIADWAPAHLDDFLKAALVRVVEAGPKKAAESTDLADFDIAPFVRVRMADDVEAARNEVKAEMGFYIGGMGEAQEQFSTTTPSYWL